MRLNKFISTYSGHSRRDADKLIETGRVRVNGRNPILGTKVSPGDRVEVDGKYIDNANLFHAYLKFSKPPGMLTSYGDELDRPNLTSVDILNRTKYPYSGRLDYASCGLIIFSNDGELIRRLQLPQYKVEKIYHVRTDKPLSHNSIDEIQSGITVEGMKYRPAKVTFGKGDLSYNITITEGKNRQIRKMLEACGVKVTFLMRVSVGNVKLGELKFGEAEDLTDIEIDELYNIVNLDRYGDR